MLALVRLSTRGEWLCQSQPFRW